MNNIVNYEANEGVDNLRNGRGIVVVLTIMIFILGLWIYSKMNTNTTELNQIETMFIKDIEFLRELNQENGFFHSVGNNLNKAGNQYTVVGMANSPEKIKIHVIVPRNEEIEIDERKTILQTIHKTISEYNLDKKVITIRIDHGNPSSNDENVIPK